MIIINFALLIKGQMIEKKRLTFNKKKIVRINSFESDHIFMMK